jgi:hypothetical protein
MYCLALFGLAVIVVTFLRMARTLTRIHQRLDEILAVMRSR